MSETSSKALDKRDVKLSTTATRMYLSVVNDDMQECYKLKNLIRYNHRSRLKDESVAEHSFYVSLFCMKLLGTLNVSEATKLLTLQYAILHDVAEYETSDLPHDVKVKYPKINTLLRMIEDDFYKAKFPEYVHLFEHGFTREGLQLAKDIVKVADLASVIQFCNNEQMLGNVSSEIVEIEKDAHVRMMNLMNGVAYTVDVMDIK